MRVPYRVKVHKFKKWKYILQRKRFRMEAESNVDELDEQS